MLIHRLKTIIIYFQNSKSDQIYKRALDSPNPNRSKQVKLSKKSADLICAICGGEAYGFNYDVLSCPSCKAFFRRNARQPPVSFHSICSASLY
jgi:rubrerythrin